MTDVCTLTDFNDVKYKVVEQHEYTRKKTTSNKRVDSYVVKQIKITLCVILGNLMLGYSIGWSAPSTTKLKDSEQTPLPYPISDKDASWTVSLFIIGSIFGANAGGYVANLIGRKYCILLFSFTNMVGYVLTAHASTYATMLVGRTLAGLAGAIAVLNLVYIGEIASPDIRGSLLTMTGICHVFGTLMAYSIGPYVSFAAVCYVCMALNCVHVLAMCYIPESPVYHVIRGKEDEAKTTLLKLGRNEDIDKELRPMLEDISEKILSETKGCETKIATKPKWKQLILEKKNRKAFLITTTLFCLQDGGGVIAIVFFATTIFKNAHSSIDPSLGTIILGLTELCGIMLTPLLIERYGRRILLLISTGFCSLSMGILGTYFYLEATQESLIASIRWLPLVLLATCLFTFNIGLAIVPNTITGEMYSPHLRSTGSSISITLAWSLAVVTGSSFGYIVSALQNHGVFWFYAGLNALGFFFTAFVVPETKGKTLMEIGVLLQN